MSIGAPWQRTCWLELDPEQISTAGYEASGTGNMKLMMNGALTIGTRDGATIELAAAAGEEAFFLFGLGAEEVANSRGVLAPILDALIRRGDHYRHLDNLKSHSEAHARLGEFYADQASWSRKAVLNIAASRSFSSDRTITDYARDIWRAEPCQVD